MIAMMMLAAAAATADRPPVALVNKIEAHALRDPCVRPLDQWWRQYAFAVTFGPKGMIVRHDIVQVSMIEAGHNGHRAGRFIVAQPEPPKIDDSQFKFASGEYDIAGHRFTRWVCGSNWPPVKGPPRKP